jgi:hypothetical protein
VQRACRVCVQIRRCGGQEHVDVLGESEQFVAPTSESAADVRKSLRV